MSIIIQKIINTAEVNLEIIDKAQHSKGYN
jgi:hypothetical protein